MASGSAAHDQPDPGPYQVSCSQGTIPALRDDYLERAELIECFDLTGEGEYLFVAVSPLSGAWPFLVVEQRYRPHLGGFDPGILLIPETGLLLVGAGERLLAYSLTGPRRLWEDQANTGFWHWDRQDDIVLMAAELELAAWDLDARKLWTTFVEPPWTYKVENGMVDLDVMGTRSRFPLATGPGKPPGR